MEMKVKFGEFLSKYVGIPSPHTCILTHCFSFFLLPDLWVRENKSQTTMTILFFRGDLLNYLCLLRMM
jgi:hypothetical protein